MTRTAQLLIVSFTIILSSCSDNKATKIPETEMEKVSYSLGVNVATGVKAQGLDTIDANAVAKAFNDVFEGNDLAISEEDGMKLLQEYFGKLQAKKQAEVAKAGADYLANNATKEGVITTKSGLQYEIINSGGGAKPTVNDQLTVHYHGMLTDGTVFDSSVDRGDPFKFPLGQGRVIPGWDEALQLMSIGDKWKLTIPSNLAYGERGQPQAGIGQNSILIFEVELIEIK